MRHPKTFCALRRPHPPDSFNRQQKDPDVRSTSGAPGNQVCSGEGGDAVIQSGYPPGAAHCGYQIVNLEF